MLKFLLAASLCFVSLGCVETKETSVLSNVIGGEVLWIEVDGVATKYEDHGDPNGSVILFLHGFAGREEDWEPFVRAFDWKYRCLALDLPGFGDTAVPAGWEFTAENYADFVADFLDELNVEQVYVVGFSMGGKVAWTFASRYRERVERLTLIDAQAYTDRCQMSGQLFAQTATHRQVAAGEILAVNGTDQIPQLSGVPTLIIWGSNDLVLPLADGERLHQEITSSSLVILPGGSHLAIAEQPERAIAALYSFLSQ